MTEVLAANVGRRFEVSTTTGDTFEGELFAYDSKTDFAVFHILPKHDSCPRSCVCAFRLCARE